MILIFLSAILLAFSSQFFYLSYSIQGLDRAIIAAPIELFVRAVGANGSEMKYEKSELEKSFLSYYGKTLKRYVKDYQVDFYYYNIEDESMCLTDECSAVEVSVNCKLINTYDYSRTMYYQLRGN